MTVIKQAWDWISNIGVSQAHPEKNELIRLYNYMSLLSAIGTIIVTFVAWQINFPFAYVLITSAISILYASVLVLNYFGKITLARLFVSIGTPLWVGVVNLLVGGYFCQGLAILASMAITYVAFQGKPKWRVAILTFNMVSFFSSTIYINTFGPLQGVIDFPFDEFMVFLGGSGWATIVLYQFDKHRTALVKNLKSNNIELKNTTEELERFTYIASHDLKSPLRTIISFIGLIERDVARKNYTNIQENLNFVKTGAEQMNFLVQDILELSKLKKHEEAVPTLIDLNVVFEKAKHNLKEDISEKDAIIHCEKLPFFLGAELELLLLFQNFIQNGIKYNESKKPSVTISASQSDTQLKLTFKDNGIGIEEQYHEKIFLFFKRLHNSIKYQGTGLGLGLCKKIINNYEGQIDIDSTMGKGTSFTLSFPISVTRKTEKALVVESV
ncbi:MAG: ATP-binding protein [Saprospiraceae bacterium]